jgi:hypothetical protein
LASERRGKEERETKETKVYVEVNLDGSGQADIATGIGMLDHLLEQIARHGLIDITIKSPSAWGGRSAKRWETSAASCASGTQSCRWMRRWRWWRST